MYRRIEPAYATRPAQPPAHADIEELLPKGRRFSDGKDFGLKDSLPRPAPEGAGLRQAAVHVPSDRNSWFGKLLKRKCKEIFQRTIKILTTRIVSK